MGRNKRSMTLNLKTDAGREIFLRLVADADVLLEGFRPGVAQRLGIDYATLSARNPRLIYCAISGYGQDGPYRDRVGHDVNYLGYRRRAELHRDGERPAGHSRRADRRHRRRCADGSDRHPRRGHRAPADGPRPARRHRHARRRGAVERVPPAPPHPRSGAAARDGAAHRPLCLLRRLRDPRRSLRHRRCVRAAFLGDALPALRPRGLHRSAVVRAAARGDPVVLSRRVPREDAGRVDGGARRQGDLLRTGQHDRRRLRRSAGPPSRHGARRRRQPDGRQPDQVVGDAGRRSARRRRCSGSTQTTCCADSASPPNRSRSSVRAGLRRGTACRAPTGRTRATTRLERRAASKPATTRLSETPE